MNKETNLEKFVHYLNNEIFDFVYNTTISIKDGNKFVIDHAEGSICLEYSRNTEFPNKSFFLAYNLNKEGFMFGRSDISEDQLKEFLVETKIRDIIKK